MRSSQPLFQLLPLSVESGVLTATAHFTGLPEVPTTIIKTISSILVHEWAVTPTDSWVAMVGAVSVLANKVTEFSVSNLINLNVESCKKTKANSWIFVFCLFLPVQWVHVALAFLCPLGHSTLHHTFTETVYYPPVQASSKPVYCESVHPTTGTTWCAVVCISFSKTCCHCFVIWHISAISFP